MHKPLLIFLEQMHILYRLHLANLCWASCWSQKVVRLLGAKIVKVDDAHESGEENEGEDEPGDEGSEALLGGWVAHVLPHDVVGLVSTDNVWPAAVDLSVGDS